MKRSAVAVDSLEDWRHRRRRPFRRGFVPFDPNAQSGASKRAALGIAVEDPAGDVTAPPVESLAEAKLPRWMVEAADEEAWTLSAMQAQLLPVVLAGENAIAVGPRKAEEVGPRALESDERLFFQALVYLVLAALHSCDQHPLTQEDSVADKSYNDMLRVHNRGSYLILIG